MHPRAPSVPGGERRSRRGPRAEEQGHRMTFILHALKRDEEDRRAVGVDAPGPAPALAAPAGRARGSALARQPPPPTSDGGGATPTTRPLWLWPAAAGLGFAVNALVFGAVFVVGRPPGVAVV